MKKTIYLIIACLGLFFSGCEKDLYENEVNTNPRSFNVKKVSLKDIPEIDAVIRKKINGFPFAYKTNKTSKTKSSVIFDIVNILEVIDKENNKNYSLRFVFENTPENIYYNLIINVLPTGEKLAFVEKYTCNISDFIDYKSHDNDFKYFNGTVELHKFTAFFDDVTFLNKTAVDCNQQYDQYGNPIPIVVTTVVDGSSSGGGSTGVGGLPTGSGTSSNVAFYGSTTNSSGGGTTGTGCCSCGNCGDHWYLPGTEDQHIIQKINVDPCVGTIPTGTIVVSNTTSPFPCLTAAKLLEVFPNASLENRNTLTKIVKVYGQYFDINTTDEMLHFIAQVGAETGGLTTLNATENLNYATPSRLVTVYKGKFSLTDLTKANPNNYINNSQALANFVYCCKYGNGSEVSGDGWKYKGRGVLQLTWKSNYQGYENYMKSIGLGWFYTSPDDLSTNSIHAILSGMWFFKTNILDKMNIDANTTADKVTRKINRNTDDISKKKRRDYFVKAKLTIIC